MFENLNKDLEFGYKRIGSLVLAFNEKEEQKLVQLFKNGTKNGVDDLQLLSGEEVKEIYCKYVKILFTNNTNNK